MPDGGQVLTVARDKRGFEDVIRIAPGWLPSYHRYAWTAHRKGDHEIAQRLFQRRAQTLSCRTSLMAGITRSAVSASALSGESMVMMAMAVPPLWLRARLYSAMLTS